MEINPPDFFSLYSKKIDTDWKFVFELSERVFDVHKLFLSASSDYFSAFLSSCGSCSEMKDSNTVISTYVKEECIETFELFFIPYIYNARVDIKDSNFIYIYQIASTWRFEKLLKQLNEYQISTKNVLKFIVQSSDRSGFFNTPNELFQHLIKIASRELGNIRNKQELVSIDMDTFLEILERCHSSCVYSDATHWMNANIERLVESNAASKKFEDFSKFIRLSIDNVIALYRISKSLNDLSKMKEYSQFISKYLLKIRLEEFEIMGCEDLLRFLSLYQCKGTEEEKFKSYNKIYIIISHCLLLQKNKKSDKGEKKNLLANELWNCLNFSYLSYENIIEFLERKDVSKKTIQKASKMKIFALVEQTKSIFREVECGITLSKIISVRSNMKTKESDLIKHLDWDIVDNSFISSSNSGGDGTWVEVEFEGSVIPSKYCLRSAASKYTPKNWDLFGVKEGKLFLLSSHREDSSIREAQTEAQFPIKKASQSFDTYRLEQRGLNWGNDGDFGIDGFKIIGSVINFSPFVSKFGDFRF